MRQINNERERNILREEEDQIGKEPIRWRRRGKERGKKEKEKRRKKKTVRGREKGKGREGKRRFSWCSEGRSLIVRDLKLVHATRATRGYRNLNFSLKPQEVGVSPTLVFSCLVAM